MLEEPADPAESRWRLGLPVVLLLLAVCLAVPTFPLWSGRAHGIWDIESFYYPAWSLLADAAREGRLILWNPWLSGGRPEMADPQVGGLSPAILLAGLAFGGSLGGFAAYWLAIWLATGVGMALLARHLGAPWWGSLIVGAGLLGSGFAVGHAQHTSFLATFAYFPWMLWRLDVALRDRRWLPAAQAGLLFGLSALGGYPALVFVLGILAAAWASGRLAFGWVESAGERPRPRFRDLALCGLLAATVALATLAPTYAAYVVEGRDFSDRTKPLPRVRAVFEGSVHPAALLTVAAPTLVMARSWERTIWGWGRYHMGSIYLGAATALLALLALWNRPRSAFRWWLVLLAAFFLALSLGPILPLRGWLYDWVPPSRYFRHSMIFRSGALLAIAVLAALAARDRQEAAEAWDRRLALLSLGATPLVALALYLARRSEAEFWQLLPRGMAMANVLAWLLPALAVGVCARWGRRALIPALLAAFALIEAPYALWSCRSMIFRDAHLAHYTQLEAARQALPPDSFEQTPRGLRRRLASRHGPVNNRDAIERVLVLRSLDPLSDTLADIFATRPLAAAAAGANRFWFAPAVAVAEANGTALAQLGWRHDQLGRPPLLLHPRDGQPPPEFLVPLEEAPPAARLPIELVSYRPESLIFDVDAPGDGYLWVTERYTRGWLATVDGEPRPVYRANLFFRAVPITAGRHRIAFAYRPFGHPWLLIVAWSTFALVALLSIRARLRKR